MPGHKKGEKILAARRKAVPTATRNKAGHAQHVPGSQNRNKG